MKALVYEEAGTGLRVLVTVWDPADIITAVLSPDPDPAPEVALRPAGAGRWGPPLQLIRTETQGA